MVGFGGYLRTSRSGSPRAHNQDAPLGCFLIVFVPILFLISSYFAWRELKYAVLAKTVDASVERVFETVDVGSRRNRRVLRVNYRFTDASNGSERAEGDTVPLRWPRPDAVVRVAYLPGQPGESRIAEHRSYLAVVFFIGCLVAAGISLAFLVREATAAVRESEQHEKRRRREW